MATVILRRPASADPSGGGAAPGSGTAAVLNHINQLAVDNPTHKPTQAAAKAANQAMAGGADPVAALNAANAAAVKAGGKPGAWAPDGSLEIHGTEDDKTPILTGAGGAAVGWYAGGPVGAALGAAGGWLLGKILGKK